MPRVGAFPVPAILFRYAVRRFHRFCIIPAAIFSWRNPGSVPEAADKIALAAESQDLADFGGCVIRIAQHIPRRLYPAAEHIVGKGASGLPVKQRGKIAGTQVYMFRHVIDAKRQVQI